MNLKKKLIVLLLGLSGTACLPVPPGTTSEQWHRLRHCESTNNYSAVSASGKYRGAYQFDLRTWRSVGGTGDPAAASRFEQDYRAYRLYLARGWQPWSCRRVV